jgi:CP family cyanate transporter-like MFS transporter
MSNIHDAVPIVGTGRQTPSASSRPAAERRSARPGILFFVAVVLLGANLRAVFSSLPPLLEDVRADLGLSAAAAGLLTTLPLLCFGLLAPLAPALIRRVSIERLLAACTALTAIGAGVRGIGGVTDLFVGTLVAGSAVAIAQTVVPTLIRARFPRHSGSLTGAFSMALPLGATAAAAAAVPLEHLFDDSWRKALAVFALPAFAAALLWLPPASRKRTVVRHAQSFGFHNLARSWSLAAYFGLQAMAFYCGLTWLPTILQHEGYSEAAAGSLQALGSALQLLPALFVPVVASRLRNQRPALVAVVAVAAAGLLGLLLAPGAAPVWMIVIGMGQGGALGLSLILPVLRGAGAVAVAALTALTLSAGYLLASIGPTLLGLARDLTGGWTIPLILLIAITLAELVPGWKATADWTIGDRDLEPSTAVEP